MKRSPTNRGLPRKLKRIVSAGKAKARVVEAAANAALNDFFWVAKVGSYNSPHGHD